MLAGVAQNDPFFIRPGVTRTGRHNPMPVEAGQFTLEAHSGTIAAEMGAITDRVIAEVYAQ